MLSRASELSKPNRQKTTPWDKSSANDCFLPKPEISAACPNISPESVRQLESVQTAVVTVYDRIRSINNLTTGSWRMNTHQCPGPFNIFSLFEQRTKKQQISYKCTYVDKNPPSPVRFSYKARQGFKDQGSQADRHLRPKEKSTVSSHTDSYTATSTYTGTAPSTSAYIRMYILECHLLRSTSASLSTFSGFSAGYNANNPRPPATKTMQNGKDAWAPWLSKRLGTK